MTRISYIHGPVPQDEVKDRAAEVKPLPYFNPLLMTEGQAYLTLMRDQVLTLAQYYPDRTIYKKGLALINNALHKGVNGITPAVGAVEPTLYPVMNAIQKFKTKTAPAVRAKSINGIGSWRDQSMVAGGIGAEIPVPNANFVLWWWMNDRQWMDKIGIPSAQKLKDYIQAINDSSNQNYMKEFRVRHADFSKKYKDLKFIVDLYNEKIDEFAYHPLYNFLPSGNAGTYTAEVVSKQLYHKAGVEMCAKQGDFSNENMSLWMRNGILHANIKGNVGAISPEQSIFSLTGLPDSEYKNWLGGNVGTSKGKWNKINSDQIGIAFVALIPLIVVAITAASSIAVAIINANQVSALSNVQGWGTQAYAASPEDFPDPSKIDPTLTTNDMNLPLIIGGGLAAYLLLSK